MTAAPVIAIVDDDSSVRVALGRLLRSVDLGVRLYVDGQALLDAVAGQSVACVLTDVHMPGVDGFALCDALRARGLHMPVIFMTAVEHDDDARRAARAGAACFLQKPFTDTQLIDCIARAVGGDVDAHGTA